MNAVGEHARVFLHLILKVFHCTGCIQILYRTQLMTVPFRAFESLPVAVLAGFEL
jgi:hypothetical protein